MKLVILLAVAVLVGCSDPQAVAFEAPETDECIPTGVGVYDTVNLTINEVLRPECK